MLRPEVALKYQATEEPSRIAVRALGYQVIDLRTLSLAEADELVAMAGGFPYLKLQKGRSKSSAVPIAEKEK